MKKTLFKAVVMLLILAWAVPAWSIPAIAQDGEGQASQWLPGTYLGWVYFVERTDYDYAVNAENIRIEDAGTLYLVSHGTLECSVFDADGSGTCSADFPMDKVLGRYGTVDSPDCQVTFWGNTLAQGISAQGFPSLIPAPLGQGFSLPFKPQSSPAQATLVVEAHGGIPGCHSRTITSQPQLGISQWPNLDFHIDFHTQLSAGGPCSMDTFPREITVGNMHTTAVIEACQWRMFYFDPYAQLPQ